MPVFTWATRCRSGIETCLQDSKGHVLNHSTTGPGKMTGDLKAELASPVKPLDITHQSLIPFAGDSFAP